MEHTKEPCIAESVTADFTEGTWLFEPVGNFRVGAGRYAIIPEGDYLELQQQRDELLAALIESRHALQFAKDNPNGGISDTIWMMHGPETLFDFMDAAIAKAKEGAR